MHFKLLLVTGFLGLVACTDTSVQNRPENRKSGVDLEQIVISKTLQAVEHLDLSNPASIGQSQRNAIIQARMAEIDAAYFDFENRLSNDIRQGNFGFGMAELLVGAAGAVSSGATSQNLSAVSALLSGTRATYNKELLLDQSLQVFITQMRANRAAVKKRITERYPLTSTQYTLQLALTDLEEYEQAGTLTTALAGLSQSAQDNEKAALGALEQTEDKVIREIRTTTKVNFGVHARSITTYVSEGTFPAEKTERHALLKQCYDTVRPGTAVPATMSLAEFTGLADSAAYKPVADAMKACMRTTYQINIP